MFKLPRILIGFDLDLLLLLIDRQSACRQHRARTLAIRCENQLNRPYTVLPGPGSMVQLAKGDIAIGDETQPAYPFLRWQFHDVLHVVPDASARESDTPFGLQILKDIDQTILTLSLECVYQELAFFRRGVLLDIDVDVVNFSQLRARSHRCCLDGHTFLSLSSHTRTG